MVARQRLRVGKTHAGDHRRHCRRRPPLPRASTAHKKLSLHAQTSTKPIRNSNPTAPANCNHVPTTTGRVMLEVLTSHARYRA